MQSTQAFKKFDIADKTRSGILRGEQIGLLKKDGNPL